MPKVWVFIVGDRRLWLRSRWAIVGGKSLRNFANECLKNDKDLKNFGWVLCLTMVVAKMWLPCNNPDHCDRLIFLGCTLWGTAIGRAMIDGGISILIIRDVAIALAAVGWISL